MAQLLGDHHFDDGGLALLVLVVIFVVVQKPTRRAVVVLIDHVQTQLVGQCPSLVEIRTAARGADRAGHTGIYRCRSKGTRLARSAQSQTQYT